MPCRRTARSPAGPVTCSATKARRPRTATAPRSRSGRSRSQSSARRSVGSADPAAGRRGLSGSPGPSGRAGAFAGTESSLMARQLMSPKTIRACTVVWKIISGRCVRGPRDLDDADPHPRGAGLRRALHEAGVPLPAGTDATPFAPGHGDGRHRELKLLTRAGADPAGGADREHRHRRPPLLPRRPRPDRPRSPAGERGSHPRHPRGPAPGRPPDPLTPDGSPGPSPLRGTGPGSGPSGCQRLSSGPSSQAPGPCGSSSK